MLFCPLFVRFRRKREIITGKPLTILLTASPVCQPSPTPGRLVPETRLLSAIEIPSDDCVINKKLVCACDGAIPTICRNGLVAMIDKLIKQSKFGVR